MGSKIIFESILHKLPSTRKNYRVTLIVPDNGIPFIDYYQLNSFPSKEKPKKTIHFGDLLFADRKYEKNEIFAFSIYTIDKTITFLAQDESTMLEWLCKIRETHSNLYPEFKRYEAVFEAHLMDRGLGKTMNIQGAYRLALSKDSLDLIPIMNNTMIQGSDSQQHDNNQNHHQTKPQEIQSQQKSQQRFHKRHPLLRSKTIELVLRSIRRCGHTDCNFYIESGRHSQIGEGDLWMTFIKKSTVRLLHELLVNAMKSSASIEDVYPHNKGQRSRSGSSNENALRTHQSRSSSLVCLALETENSFMLSKTNNNNNNVVTDGKNNISDVPMDEDGYLPMA